MLGFCVAWLIYTHVVYAPAPPDKELEMTPQGPSQQHTGIFDKAVIEMPGDLSYIYDNNIFLTNRGQVEKVEGKPQPVPYKGAFELTGLFKIEDVKGAIINSKGSRGGKAVASKFYRVDESIGDSGFTLEAISSKEATATLSNGRSKIILKLDKDDSGSLRRREDAVKQQEAVEQKLQLSTKTSPVIKKETKKTPLKPVVQSASKTKSAKEIAEIRRKILERMRANKSKTK